MAIGGWAPAIAPMAEPSSDPFAPLVRLVGTLASIAIVGLLVFGLVYFLWISGERALAAGIAAAAIGLTVASLYWGWQIVLLVVALAGWCVCSAVAVVQAWTGGYRRAPWIAGAVCSLAAGLFAAWQCWPLDAWAFIVVIGLATAAPILAMVVGWQRRRSQRESERVNAERQRRAAVAEADAAAVRAEEKRLEQIEAEKAARARAAEREERERRDAEARADAENKQREAARKREDERRRVAQHRAEQVEARASEREVARALDRPLTAAVRLARQRRILAELYSLADAMTAGSVTVAELADATGLRVGSVYNDLSALREDGHVGLDRDDVLEHIDWRRTAVRITASGKAEVARHVGHADAERSPEPAEDARIVFFTANPRLDLRTDTELRDVRKALQATTYRDRVHLDQVPAASADDILERISSLRPHIVHFAGHAGATGIVLDDGHSRHPGEEVVDYESLARVLGATDRRASLVVLNGCTTAPAVEPLLRTTEIVVTIDEAVGDAAARTFSPAFYRHLANGQSVWSAFEAARALMQAHGMSHHHIYQLDHRAGLDPTKIGIFGDQ